MEFSTATGSLPTVPAATKFQPLTLMGDAGAACVGDFCEIPEPRQQAVVNDLIDSGNI